VYKLIKPHHSFYRLHSCSLFLKRTTVDSDSNPTLFIPRIHSHQRFIDLETGLGRGNKRVSPSYLFVQCFEFVIEIIGSLSFVCTISRYRAGHNEYYKFSIDVIETCRKLQLLTTHCKILGHSLTVGFYRV